MDILPTLAEITGAELPEQKIDGISILPLLLGQKDAAPRHVFYYYYRQNSLEGVQKDFWKLVLPHPGISYVGVEPGKDGWPGKTQNITVDKIELYDLRRDPGERYNVAELYPEVLTELQSIAEQARLDLGDDITKAQGLNRRKAGSILPPTP